MIPGTTPTHIFTLPIDTGTIKAVRVTYQQFGRTIVEKTERDIKMSGKQVELTLTQEESVKFYENQKIKVQMKVLTASGAVLSHKPILLETDEILNKEVLL